MALSSFFPTSSMGPLFRLLDDSDFQRLFDTSAALSSLSNTPYSVTKSMTRSFSPRFDARETKDAYHLEGELPGVRSKDLDIEFTDPHTLVLRGTSSRESFTSNENNSSEDDEGGDASKGSSEGTESAGAGTVATTTQNNSDSNKQVGQAAPSHRYWIAERSDGSFHRTFNFPTRVDQEGVRASLKEGILTITVPKIAAPGSKKIRVD